MKKEGNVQNTTSIVVQILLNVLFYGVAIFITMTCANKAYDFAYQIYGDVAVAEAPGKSKDIEIKEGMSILQVADKLYDNKLIVDKYSFILKFKLTEMTIKPGKYTISNACHYDEIIDTICGVSSKEGDNSFGDAS